MKESIHKPKQEFRTIQNKTKAANQAPISQVLQNYKEKNIRSTENVQRQEMDEDELLQGKFDTRQREVLDEDELIQGKFDKLPDSSYLTSNFPVQREEVPNRTGLPDNLKSGIENLSGYSMDDVRVHYNSSKPAQLQALAYTQGTDIHVAPGQEKHLPHEAWHVVQQKQGRVQPTMQLQGVNVNDNEGLEKEADEMGGRSIQFLKKDSMIKKDNNINKTIIQRKVGFEFETGWRVEVKTRHISTSDSDSNVYHEYLYNCFEGRRETFSDSDSEVYHTCSFDEELYSEKYIQNPKVGEDGYSPMNKKDIIYIGSLFHIEADDCPSGTELEFVTNPLITKEELIMAMDEINQIVDVLISKNESNMSFILGDFRITPNDNEMKAGIQVTFGMPLKKFAFMNKISPETKYSETRVSNLHGLVELIMSYIFQARSRTGRIDYPKVIVDPIMARTDFAKLFSIAMEEDEINKEILSIDDWIKLFSLRLQLFNICNNLNIPLFRPTIGVEDRNEILTINDWLRSIYNDGIDLLARIEDHEGMGALGDKTDVLENSQVGIFELRSQVTTNRVPANTWKNKALSWFDEIATLIITPNKYFHKNYFT